MKGGGGSYQVSNDFLKELGTFFHLVLRPSQLDDVALLRRVGEINNNLEVNRITLQSKLNHESLFNNDE